MEYFIGLDAHSKTCTFIVIDQNGKETHRLQVNTTEFNLLRVVQSIPGPKSLTFEECHLSQWLYTLFKKEVEHLVICNPRYITKRKGSKDDVQDALHLAQLLRGNFLTPVFHQESKLMELRSLMGAYQDSVKEYTQARNRFKALFLRQAQRLEGRIPYRDVTLIEKLPLVSDQFVARQLITQIGVLEQTHKDYLKYFKNLSENIPEIALLQAIPGIAEVRACVIAATIVDARRFKNKHHFWAYCELVKHQVISDGVVYGKKGKRANRMLKAVFIGAAKTALGCEGDLKEYYLLLRKKGMNYKMARRVLARMIASIALSILRTAKPYQESIVREKIKQFSTKEKETPTLSMN